jgi:uncharacterized protein
MTEQLSAKISDAVDRLVREFQPDSVYLFGSHAWGEPNDDSDVDFLVIVPQSNQRPIERMQRAVRCLRGIDFPTDVLVSTREEFNRYRNIPASLPNQISTRGKRLYGPSNN